ncbi:diversity-generating retroelement protein Avd [Thermodesulfovibrio sp. 1176]|uniref:diversity-generating retroelement protein Avd n=1 Tax=unclassified Thermodesulfovibrio TaxID=2645936 RepID=UPI0009F34851|nr:MULTISPECIES: diversity-generating retroelement protein Avd [unclassified Thermodesulfovibrio]MDI1471943.1 diversity-generating retroelement protein Avd [Thermodesulfovibrio sp. 1176]
MENLKLYQKLYDFAMYIFPIIDKFPRYEKFALCSQIKNCVFDAAKLVIKANKIYNKKPIMYEIDIKIEELKFLLRFAHERRYMSHKSYSHSSERLIEIGRILGGWIKSV